MRDFKIGISSRNNICRNGKRNIINIFRATVKAAAQLSGNENVNKKTSEKKKLNYVVFNVGMHNEFPVPGNEEREAAPETRTEKSVKFQLSRYR